MSQKATSRFKTMTKSSSSESDNPETSSKSHKPNTTNTSKAVPKNQPQKYRSKSKSVSASTLPNTTKKPVVIPKKVIKSELSIKKKGACNRIKLDVCRKCGDGADMNKKVRIDRPHSGTVHKQSEKGRNIGIRRDGSADQISNGKSMDQSRYNSKVVQNAPKKKSFIKQRHAQVPKQQTHCKIKQFYKNNNFKVASESAYKIEDMMKNTKLLDTITELPEIQTIIEDISSDDTEFFKVYSEVSDYISSKSDSELKNLDADVLKKIKEFRDSNYFECHSSKTRIQRKGSVTSLGEHKCVYRFYLNDRLFPEPLDMDTSRKIRCVECQLPLKLNETTKSDSEDDTNLNGTILAKVKVGADDRAHDTIVTLPVNSSLIIREKRREPRVDEDIYFGVIKLGHNGHSGFKNNFTGDSFALKYQKGYREFEDQKELRFDKGERDVIVV